MCTYAVKLWPRATTAITVLPVRTTQPREQSTRKGVTGTKGRERGGNNTANRGKEGERPRESNQKNTADRIVLYLIAS